jgi:hypothetical protein
VFTGTRVTTRRFAFSRARSSTRPLAVAVRARFSTRPRRPSRRSRGDARRVFVSEKRQTASSNSNHDAFSRVASLPHARAGPRSRAPPRFRRPRRPQPRRFPPDKPPRERDAVHDALRPGARGVPAAARPAVSSQRRGLVRHDFTFAGEGAASFYLLSPSGALAARLSPSPPLRGTTFTPTPRARTLTGTSTTTPSA